MSYERLPAPMAGLMRRLEDSEGFRIVDKSTKMQTMIYYKEEKIGGANKAHAYISKLVVQRSSDFEKTLVKLGFQKKEHPVGHVHWKIPVLEVASFRHAVEGACKVIDETSTSSR